MSTETQSPKVQQGPHLREAIAELPIRSSGKLCREKLENASPGEVAGAINDRIQNDLPHIVDVMVHAAGLQGEAFVDQVQVGLMVLGRNLEDEFRQIGHLAWAIWADERGLPLRVEDRR